MARNRFSRNQVCSYFGVPNNPRPVRFLGWFDAARTYARVEFLMTGTRIAVPVQYLKVEG